jgi:hypothetical protein
VVATWYLAFTGSQQSSKENYREKFSLFTALWFFSSLIEAGEADRDISDEGEAGEADRVRHRSSAAARHVLLLLLSYSFLGVHEMVEWVEVMMVMCWTGVDGCLLHARGVLLITSEGSAGVVGTAGYGNAIHGCLP